MSIEKVREYFRQYGMEERVREEEHSSATVEEAAEALGCEPQRIAKTLSFYLEDSAILIVMAGDRKIDNKKYRKRFGCKAHMLKFEDVEPMIVQAVGVEFPLGIDVYLDESLKRFETVFPAAGSSNSMIELTISELEKYSCYKAWVDVCREG